MLSKWPQAIAEVLSRQCLAGECRGRLWCHLADCMGWEDLPWVSPRGCIHGGCLSINTWIVTSTSKKTADLKFLPPFWPARFSFNPFPLLLWWLSLLSTFICVALLFAAVAGFFNTLASPIQQRLLLSRRSRAPVARLTRPSLWSPSVPIGTVSIFAANVCRRPISDPVSGAEIVWW
jgi:hypothetical protein